MVLAAGVILVIALGLFFAKAKFRNRFNRKDIPQRLGLNIQEEANDFVYVHNVGGHALYKIQASKQVQLKQGDRVLLQLHDVKIELYGEDGSRVDRIEGGEFEYDPGSGIAKAIGPVNITVMRPTVAPAIAPKATPKQAIGANSNSTALAAAAQTASRGEIYVKTSGLVFDRNTGAATTNERVEFTLAQGSGNAMGATYDAHEGRLVLDHEVELITQRGVQPVTMHSQYAEFERDDQTCFLRAATVQSRGDRSSAAEARIYFRDDGSAQRLDAAKGFLLTTSAGGRLAAPTGRLDFDEHNEPRHGHLEGGVTIDSHSNGRQVHGTAPTMELEFSDDGQLRKTHLERGVKISSDEQAVSAGEPMRVHRSWSSPLVDIAFRDNEQGNVEPSSIHGTGGVAVTAESQRGNSPTSPSRLTADDVTGTFGPDSALTAMTGIGDASIFEVTATGTRQTTNGDKLVAHFAPAEKSDQGDKRSQVSGSTQIESATVDGHVVMLQEPPPKPGAPPDPNLRATSGRAEYESTGQWVHLAESPHVTDGSLDLTADKIDVSQDSGNAFAHGNVKATYIDTGKAVNRKPAKGASSQDTSMLGAEGPEHAVSAEAEFNHATGVATFTGKARVWQQANSVEAPVIVLDRTKQTLSARSTTAADPVQVVLVSATASPSAKGAKAKGPSVIQVRGGDLKYSSTERKALMHSGSAGKVVAITSDATTVSDAMEVILLPPGNHAGKEGAAAQVDRMTSKGHVIVTSEGRHGTGEQLVYSSKTENYVLTGTAATPPNMTDPIRGMVTGDALIFNSRDDSVSIDGGGRKTTTVTTAPK
jgi:lipopolysaccharide export system protein LptA